MTHVLDHGRNVRNGASKISANMEVSLPGALNLEVLWTWDLSVRQVRRWGAGEGGRDSRVAVDPSYLAAY